MATKKKSAGRKVVKPRKALTVMVLDQSGSMSRFTRDVIGGVNAYIDTLAKGAKGSGFALVRFATDVKAARLWDDVSEATRLDASTYIPDGMTALYDATMAAIAEADNWVAKHKNGSVVVTIYTDGEENMSRKFKQADVFEAIQKRQKDGWEFIYLGAHADAWAAGQKMGVSPMGTYNYDAGQTRPLMAAVAGQRVNSLRAGVSMTMSLDADDQLKKLGLKKAEKKD